MNGKRSFTYPTVTLNLCAYSTADRPLLETTQLGWENKGEEEGEIRLGDVGILDVNEDVSLRNLSSRVSNLTQVLFVLFRVCSGMFRR